MSWRSKKHGVVSLSSVGSEYCAMVNLPCGLIWVKVLMLELGLSLESSMRLYYDNQIAIHITENLIFQENTTF